VHSTQAVVLTVRVQGEIERSLEQVFEQLVQFSDYPAWNPFIVRVDGAARAEAGARVRFTVRWVTGGSTRTFEEVTRVRPPDASNTAEVAWRFNGTLATLGLLNAERVQTLTGLTASRTRYFSEERFGGPLAPFVPYARVQAGFEAQARAMKVDLP
jgi:hypothetical protein